MLKRAVPVLHVSNSKEAETFYCGSLGFRRAFAYRPTEGQGDPSYTGLSRDGVWLHLSSFPGDGVVGGVANLYVANVDVLHSELIAKGVRPDMEPTTQTWGTRELYVKDSDGNSLRFIQEGAEASGVATADQHHSPETRGTRFEGAAPILSVADMAASVRYYVDVLGFRNADWGDADFTAVTRGEAAIYLCRGGQGHPGTWAWIGVENVDSLYEEYRFGSAVIRQAPRNYPWALEMHIEDPDGHVLRFGSEPLADRPFDAWQD